MLEMDGGKGAKNWTTPEDTSKTSANVLNFNFLAQFRWGMWKISEKRTQKIKIEKKTIFSGLWGGAMRLKTPKLRKSTSIASHTKFQLHSSIWRGVREGTAHFSRSIAATNEISVILTLALWIWSQLNFDRRIFPLEYIKFIVQLNLLVKFERFWSILWWLNDFRFVPCENYPKINLNLSVGFCSEEIIVISAFSPSSTIKTHIIGLLGFEINLFVRCGKKLWKKTWNWWEKFWNLPS